MKNFWLLTISEVLNASAHEFRVHGCEFETSSKCVSPVGESESTQTLGEQTLTHSVSEWTWKINYCGRLGTSISAAQGPADRSQLAMLSTSKTWPYLGRHTLFQMLSCVISRMAVL